MKYQPENKRLYGWLKKKLEGVVVDAGQLPWTLLIDDEDAYTIRGEEMNFFKVRYNCEYYTEFYRFKPRQEFDCFHKAYYIRGALEEILGDVESKGITLAQASSDFRARVEDGDPFAREEASLPYFESGLKLLVQYDPELKFYFAPGRI